MMNPHDAVLKAEMIFDEATATALDQFKEASEAETWDDVLDALKAIASTISTAGTRIASYAGVAARQINRMDDDSKDD